jgi:hypothetical protein
MGCFFHGPRQSNGMLPRDGLLARHRPVAGLLLDVIAQAVSGLRYKKRAQEACARDVSP